MGQVAEIMRRPRRLGRLDGYFPDRGRERRTKKGASSMKKNGGREGDGVLQPTKVELAFSQASTRVFHLCSSHEHAEKVWWTGLEYEGR